MMRCLGCMATHGPPPAWLPFGLAEAGAKDPVVGRMGGRQQAAKPTKHH